MWIPIIIAVVFIATVVAVIILNKKPTPVPSPLPTSPVPNPSPTPLPPGSTVIEVLNAEPNSSDIISIRVDGKLVDGNFPLKPGHLELYSTDQVGTGLDVQIRFSDHPAGTDSLAIYCGSYKDCVTAPARIHDFTGVPVDGTKIDIDYDEVGC